MLFRQGSGDGVDFGYFFAVDGGDEVASDADFLIADQNGAPCSVQAGGVGGRSRSHFLNQQTARGGKLQGLRDIARDVDGGDAETRGLAAGPEIVEHVFGAVNRERESDADAAAVGSVNRGVD